MTRPVFALSVSIQVGPLCFDVKLRLSPRLEGGAKLRVDVTKTQSQKWRLQNRTPMTRRTCGHMSHVSAVGSLLFSISSYIFSPMHKTMTRRTSCRVSHGGAVGFFFLLFLSGKWLLSSLCWNHSCREHALASAMEVTSAPFIRVCFFPKKKSTLYCLFEMTQ